VKIKVFSFGFSDELKPAYLNQVNEFLEKEGCMKDNTQIIPSTCTGVNSLGDVFINLTLVVVY